MFGYKNVAYVPPVVFDPITFLFLPLNVIVLRRADDFSGSL